MLVRHQTLVRKTNANKWILPNSWLGSIALVLLLTVTTSVVTKLQKAVQREAYVTCVIEDSKSSAASAQGVCFY